MKPAYSNADASFGEIPSPAYSFTLPVEADEVVSSTKTVKNRRYHGLRLENGLWIKWVPSPALTKWKSPPMEM